MRSASPRRRRMLCMGATLPAAGRRGIGKNVDGGVRADHRDPHVVGFDRQRRAEAGHLERAGIGRVANQQVGRVQADGIERAAHRHAEVLVADAAAILDRRQQAGRHDMQGRCHAAASLMSSARRRRPAGRRPPARAGLHIRAATPARSRPCRPAAAAASTRRACRSHSGTGQRPMRCQPHGVSAGKMQVMVIAIASDPAGIFIRGDCRRGSASSVATSPR